MKNIKSSMVVAAIVLGVAGCATAPVVLTPVGPNPARSAETSANGKLEVFSAVQQSDEQENIPLEEGIIGIVVPSSRVSYQRTDYNIYDAHGRRVEHVFNNLDSREPVPRVVALAPGRYVVEAESRDALLVRLPVEIEPGRVTKVHLDDAWEISASTPRSELVSMPSGSPVGWRADARGAETP